MLMTVHATPRGGRLRALLAECWSRTADENNYAVADETCQLASFVRAETTPRNAIRQSGVYLAPHRQIISNQINTLNEQNKQTGCSRRIDHVSIRFLNAARSWSRLVYGQPVSWNPADGRSDGVSNIKAKTTVG